MLDMLKRHEIQVLRKAGHSQSETAELAGVGERTVRRVEAEPAVATVDSTALPSAPVTSDLTIPPPPSQKLNRPEFPELPRQNFRNPHGESKNLGW